MVYKSHIVTGCIGLEQAIMIEDFDSDSGNEPLDRDVFPTLERDDHNNPSVIVWRDRLCTPSRRRTAATRTRSTARRSRVQLPLTRRWSEDGRWGADLGPSRKGKGCGLGYTYPNLVVGRLAAVPVRARAVLGAVLHLHGGRQDVGAVADARAEPAGPLRLAPASACGPYAKYAEGPRRVGRRRRCRTAIPASYHDEPVPRADRGRRACSPPTGAGSGRSPTCRSSSPTSTASSGLIGGAPRPRVADGRRRRTADGDGR